MYGKISGLLIVFAYVIIPVSFLMRYKIGFLVVKMLMSIGVVKPNNLPELSTVVLSVVIFSGVVSVLSVAASIVFGHYSRHINEEYGVWLNIAIGFGYLYFIIILVIVWLFKNFRMSGYR